jgi:alpha-tubulin suppressor-like RCC1 family protein
VNCDVTNLFRKEAARGGAFQGKALKHVLAAGFLLLFMLTAAAAHAVSPKIVAGRGHTVALMNNGTVWAWGANSNGQLGDGTIMDRSKPVRVGTFTNYTSIAAGDSHTIALRQGGTVWSWGGNSKGQLGVNTTKDSPVPVQVSGLSNINAIAAGTSHTLALKSDGTLLAWGANNYGQLGDNSITEHHAPVAVSSITNVIAIAAGGDHSIALKSDSTVWAWGRNASGQLGDNTTTDRKVPVQVTDLANVIAIAAGVDYSIALKEDGTVWAWGNNSSGQLGDGTNTEHHAPVQVSLLDDAKVIAAGYSHAVALINDDTVRAWGSNSSGQLGDGTSINRSSPVKSIGLDDVTAVAAGLNYSLVLKEDGTIWTWGDNSHGQRGNGTTTAISTPQQVDNLFNVTNIAAGAGHTIVRKSDETVWGLGNNGNGQLGNGTTTSSFVPVPVSGLISFVTTVAAGNGTTLALMNDGSSSVKAWGNNSSGQLGDGTTTERHTPVQVGGGLNIITAIAAGSGHSVALRQGGTVWTWGANNFGQLGDGTTTERHTPVQVSQSSGLSSVTAIAAGSGHTVALRSDLTVWAWGNNSNGQLGDGTVISRSAPVQVPVSGLTNITAIAAGNGYSVALRGDGTVWAWGANNFGQLGDSTTTDHHTPVQVSGLTGIKAIAAGNGHTVALTNSGTVWAWGANEFGQLGDGTTTNRSVPVQVIQTSGLSNITAVAAGDFHSVALKNDGTVWSWGSNSAGQIGLDPAWTPPVKAQINLLTFKVTFTTDGSGHGTLSGNTSQQISYGGNTTPVTAKPDAFYFVQWTEGGEVEYTTNVLTVHNVTADHDFIANFVIDLDPPTGTVGITGSAGAAYTKTRRVTLNLTADDGDGSGVSQVCISNTNTSPCKAWSAFVPPSMDKGWNLATGDGPKTVYVNYKDKVGNVSAPVSAAITLDTKAPVSGGLLAIAIPAGYDALVPTKEFDLSWPASTDALSDVAGYILVRGTTGYPSSCSKGTQLFDGTDLFYNDTGLTPGTTYYYRLCAKDNAGNISAGVTASKKALFEFTPPANGSVIINNGFGFTNTSKVDLQLYADDIGGSGVSQMCISNTPICAKWAWTPYATTKSWSLSSGDGLKTVYVLFKDAAGNVTAAPSTATTTLDKKAPKNGTLQISDTFNLIWSGFSDATSGIASYVLVRGTSGYPACREDAAINTFDQTATSFDDSLTTVAGKTYYYRVCAIDVAGNVSSGAKARKIR